MGIETLFLNHIRTDDSSKDPKMHSILLRTGSKIAIAKIKEFYKLQNYINIYSKEEYLEVYAEQFPYEVTCYVLEDGGKTTINVLFVNNEGYKKKKAFLEFMDELREFLKDLIYLN